MKPILIVLCVLFGVSLGAWTPGLRLKFKLAILGFGETYFYDVPKTVNEAKEQNWELYTRPEGQHLPQLQMYCYPNLIVCLLFDDTEAVAGLQIALPENSITGYPFDYITQGFTKWTPGNGVSYWTLQQYFVSEEYLAQPREQRIQSRDPSKTLQEDAVWLTGTHQKILKVSADVNTLANSGDWSLENCIPWMGTHYYYNMTNDMQCTADQMYPWFSLTDSGQLIGTGLAIVGKVAVDPQRDWLEIVGRLETQVTVPTAPECLYELAQEYGMTTLHIYYIDTPRQVGCDYLSTLFG